MAVWVWLVSWCGLCSVVCVVLAYTPYPVLLLQLQLEVRQYAIMAARGRFTIALIRSSFRPIALSSVSLHSRVRRNS